MIPHRRPLKLYRGPEPLSPRWALPATSPALPEGDKKRSGPDLIFWLVMVAFVAFYCWFLAGIASACPCTGDSRPCECRQCDCSLQPTGSAKAAPSRKCAVLPWRSQIEQRLQQQKQAPPAPPGPQTDPAVIAALNHLADVQGKTLDALVKLHQPYQQIPLGGPPLQTIPLGGPPSQVINLGGQPHVLIPLGGLPKQTIPLGPPPSQAPDSPKAPTPAPAPSPIPLGAPVPAMPKVTGEPSASQRYTKVKAYALYRP